MIAGVIATVIAVAALVPAFYLLWNLPYRDDAGPMPF